VIDSTYPLSETRKAIERVASGRTRGTIVIDVTGQPHPAVVAAATVTEAPVALSIPV
jgi:Zinc-binding dehydrogenase